MPDQDPSADGRNDAAEKAGSAKATKKTTAKKATTKKTPAKKTTAKAATKKATPAKKTTKPRAKKAVPPAAAEPVAPPAEPDEEPIIPKVSAAERRAGAFPVEPRDIDRSWLESYPPLVPESYPYPDVPFSRLLDDAAKDFPDSVAVDFLGKTLTYRRVSEQVARFATALQTLGVSKGDRVGVALPNCPQHLIAFIAILRLGAVVVEIDVTLDERGLAHRINDSGCRVLVVLDPVYAKVENLKGQVPTVEHVIGTAVADYLTPWAGLAFRMRNRRNSQLVHRIPEDEGVLRFTDLVRRNPATASQAQVDPGNDVALLAYDATRGGPPRAVMLTHRNLLVNVFQIRLWVPDVQAGRETILCAVPFSVPFGLTTGLGLGILAAATMALVPSLDRDEALASVERRKPTIFPATSAMVAAARMPRPRPVVRPKGVENGTAHRMVSRPACTSGTHSRIWKTLTSRLRWVSMTARGRPVVVDS